MITTQTRESIKRNGTVIPTRFILISNKALGPPEFYRKK